MRSETMPELAITSSPLAQLTHIALSLDALNCGAMLVGRNGTIAHVNPRLCEMVQRPREELVGLDFTSLYPAGEALAMLGDVLKDFGRPREAEFFLPLANGQRLPVIFSARAVGTGSLLGEYSVVTLIDISPQKSAEQRLLDQNHQINELNDKVMYQARSLREYAEQLEERVRQRTDQLHEAHMETIYMLAIASEAKDEDTAAHVRRLRRSSQALALQMGITTSNAEEIGYAAVLHDVGKIHTPDRVLKKPGPLTTRERARMEEHTLAGERILRPSPYFLQSSKVARSHHENWDGSGYPDRLAGTAIPLDARIVHLLDVYDALTHPRVYKPAWDRTQAIEEIHRNRGKMFDPAIVDAFDQMEEKGDLLRVEEQVATLMRG